jgi:N-acetyl-anhydromuramyl-L-alanine amidase AmpD
MDIGVSEIRQWHLRNGWSDIGYHYVIRRDGTLEVGRLEDEVGAHVAGVNWESVGVCLVGGVNDSNRPDCNFTSHQWRELELLIASLARRYPQAVVQGHRDFPNVDKACPCFDVGAWWGETT